ncbi:MAG: DNA-processing protein DprA [Pseudomonadota bacterium]
MQSLSDVEKRDWLRLSRSHGIGPLTCIQLVNRFGSASKAISSLPDLLKAKNSKRIKLASAASAAAEWQSAQALGVSFIALPEPDYPQGLRAIPDPPPIISVRGQTSLLAKPSIAIVGARNASAPGRRFAQEIARNLGGEGVIVTSGLARGVDGAAHAAALHTGTVAVVAGGVDQIYPPEHAELYNEIVELGAIVSEVRFGHVARARDFPKRNRIVSGLSLGVVVVEAAEKSGTLITARLALEQGREVFAVPGSPLDPRSAGTNRLIREGAVLIRSADDILEVIGDMGRRVDEEDGPAFTAPSAPPTSEEAASLRAELLSLLTIAPTHRDLLIRETGAPPAYIADVLLDLVLSGEVEETPGGSFILGVPPLDSESE